MSIRLIYIVIIALWGACPICPRLAAWPGATAGNDTRIETTFAVGHVCSNMQGHPGQVLTCNDHGDIEWRNPQRCFVPEMLIPCNGLVLTSRSNGTVEWQCPMPAAEPRIAWEVWALRMKLYVVMVCIYITLSAGIRLRHRMAHVEALLKRFNIDDTK